VDVIAGRDVAVDVGVMVNVGDEVIVADTDGVMVTGNSICPLPTQFAKNKTNTMYVIDNVYLFIQTGPWPINSSAHPICVSTS
jgi:hypothetical protein